MSSEGQAQNTACPFSSAQAISLEKAERHRRISQPGILSGAVVACLSVVLLLAPLSEEGAELAGSIVWCSPLYKQASDGQETHHGHKDLMTGRMHPANSSTGTPSTQSKWHILNISNVLGQLSVTAWKQLGVRAGPPGEAPYPFQERSR
ncbi:hypothetical protein O3P69_015976 [Scylla paramamosain]|uniref:Uncharacterized protein n=1 Tax=Scylla paramamosain TaxID=85552 RepID=A0AAW0TB04_SCYPA